MVNEKELKTFWRIAGIHVALIAVLLLGPVLHGCFRREPEEEVIAVVDLAVVPPAPMPPPQAVPEPEPEPEPEPVPIPEPEPEPEPEPIRAPEPEPEPEPKKKEIEVSRKRVKRPDAAKPERHPQPTPEEIRKMLAKDLKTSSDRTTVSDIPGWYYAHVRARMHSAWVEPTGLSLPPGAVARVRIRVERSGSVSKRDMIKSSGNSVMDRSVMRAVDSVAKLKPLPAEVRGGHKEITIDFELEQGF